MFPLDSVVFCNGKLKSILFTTDDQKSIVLTFKNLVSVMPTSESDTNAFRLALELRATDIRCSSKSNKIEKVRR